jgi:anti-sigma factor RsiW
MTCRHCRSLFSSYLDERLPAEKRQEIQVHLTQCSSCTEHLRQLTHNQQLIRALPAAEVTSRMHLRLQARLQHLAPSPQSLKPQASSLKPLPWWREWPMLSYGTVATCAASLLFYFAMMQSPSQVSAEEVVSSMDQLIGTLDPDEGERAITEETPDEAMPNWSDETDRELFENENEQD